MRVPDGRSRPAKWGSLPFALASHQPNEHGWWFIENRAWENTWNSGLYLPASAGLERRVRQWNAATNSTQTSIEDRPSNRSAVRSRPRPRSVDQARVEIGILAHHFGVNIFSPSVQTIQKSVDDLGMRFGQVMLLAQIGFEIE